MATLLRIFHYQRRYWRPTSLAYGCLILATLIELYVPDLIRQVIDCGIAGLPRGRSACPPIADPLALVAWAASLAVGLTVIRGGLEWGRGFLSEFSAQGIARDLRGEIYSHLQRLSFSWHDQAHTGEIMARATSDVEQMRNFTGRGFIMLAQMVLMALAITIILFATNWILAIVSVVSLPFLGQTIARYNRAVQPLFGQVQEELARLAGIAQENIAGAKVVKAFAREPHEIGKFSAQNAALQQQYVQAAEISVFTDPLMDVVAQVGSVLVLWMGGVLVITGELTVGQLIAFNAYLLLLMRPIRRLGFMVSHCSLAMAAAKRIFEILDAPLDVASKPGAVRLPPIRGEVVFDHVWCSYYRGDPVLRDVSFHTSPGQTVALLGATGSGKTSIVNLVPRFYDVSEGRVLVDGYDVRDVELPSLRQQIGMVLQDTVLFGGTLRENIAFGVPGATDEQVVAAARAARAEAFILEFPQGYDTRVGERGVTLSGGQKQRVAIARALLLDPRILILDDFTSAVDTETEALIREALAVLMKGRTTFVIAQRVSTVQSADMIIVLEKGQIAGTGTHRELMESNSIYAEIYQLQLMDETVAGLPSLALPTTSRSNGKSPPGAPRGTSAPSTRLRTGAGRSRP